jgi:6-phosphogluconolactonase
MLQDNRSRRDFLKATGLGVLGLAVPYGLRGRTLQTSHELTLYVGTYTAGKKSEGIYLYRINTSTGELNHFNTVKGVVDPSFLAVDRRRRYLYAVNEVSQFAGKPSGAVSAFQIDAKTGNLKFLNQQPSLGGSPCHVSVDKTDRFVLVANYEAGNVTVLPVAQDGSLGLATDTVQHHGSSVKKEQEGPHAHCIIVDDSNRYAFAADLGLDKILIYRFDVKRGKLNPGRQPWAQVKPGAGPRHFTFHPNGRYAYVINELDSTFTAFTYGGATGTLKEIHTVSTLPTDFSGANSCAELSLSPSGKFLYGSNRGHNSIVSFAINESTGKLTYLEHALTQGKTPRNFTIDPTGALLLVANQDSDTVVTFRIDSRTGRLTPTGQVAEIPTPVCLLTVPRF